MKRIFYETPAAADRNKSRKSRESRIRRAVSPAQLAFSQALFSSDHCFSFIFNFKSVEDVLKDLNRFVEFYFFLVKIALFWDCYSAFHYFRVFLLV